MCRINSSFLPRNYFKTSGLYLFNTIQIYIPEVAIYFRVAHLHDQFHVVANLTMVGFVFFLAEFVVQHDHFVGIDHDAVRASGGSIVEQYFRFIQHFRPAVIPTFYFRFVQTLFQLIAKPLLFVVVDDSLQQNI